MKYRFREVRARLDKAGFPKALLTVLADNYYEQRTDWVNSGIENYKVFYEYVQKHKNSFNMTTFSGQHGTGKTHFASLIASHYAWDNKQIKYLKQAEMNSLIRSTYTPESGTTEHSVIKQLINYDLLVLDELGSYVKGSDAESRYLQEVVTGRYMQEKSTVLVTNLSWAEFSKYAGSWISDRLKGDSCKMYFFTGESQRGK